MKNYWLEKRRKKNIQKIAGILQNVSGWTQQIIIGIHGKGLISQTKPKGKQDDQNS